MIRLTPINDSLHLTTNHGILPCDTYVRDLQESTMGKRSCTVQRIQGNTFSVNTPTSRTRSNIVVKPTNTKDTTQEYGVCSDLSFGYVFFLQSTPHEQNYEAYSLQTPIQHCMIL